MLKRKDVPKESWQNINATASAVEASPPKGEKRYRNDRKLTYMTARFPDTYDYKLADTRATCLAKPFSATNAVDCLLYRGQVIQKLRDVIKAAPLKWKTIVMEEKDGKQERKEVELLPTDDGFWTELQHIDESGNTLIATNEFKEEHRPGLLLAGRVFAGLDEKKLIQLQNLWPYGTIMAAYLFMTHGARRRWLFEFEGGVLSPESLSYKELLPNGFHLGFRAYNGWEPVTFASLPRLQQ